MPKFRSTIKPPTAAEFALALSAGEGQFVEFKESVSDSLAREFVAFANAGGGRIYVGVADDKKVKGITVTNRILSQVQDIARNCDPPVNVQLAPFKYQGHDLLMIEVIDGDQKPHGCSAGYFLRTGPTSQKMNRRELVGLLRGVGELRFDEMLCERFRYPADFSASAFRAFLSASKISTSSVSREDLLVNLKLARRLGKKLILNNAAILFFAKNPRLFHQQSRITCVLFQGTQRTHILDRKDFDGRIVENVEGAMTFVQQYIPVRYEITGLKRKEIPAIPESAIREAVLNAVIHRDYFERGAVVMVELDRDSLRVINPGGLLPGFRVEDLGRFSAPRNPLIADLFHRMGYVERVGTGVRRIRDAVAEAGLEAPEFESHFFFVIRFPLPQTPGHVPPERLGTDLVQLGTKSVPSWYQVEVLTFCLAEKSFAEIWARFATEFKKVNRARFRDDVVRPLMEAGLLSATIPDKPRSRFQKYVTTAEGKKWLKEVQT